MLRPSKLVVRACIAWAACATVVSARDFAPESPLLAVIQTGDEAKSMAVLKAQPHLATHAGNRGLPPICAAADRGFAELVDALISGGADPKATDLRNGQNALHYVAANGSVTVAASLLRAGVPVDKCDYAGNTPLHYAGSTKIALVLINSGADVNIKNSRRVPAWYQVAFRGSDRVDSALKAKGIDLKAASDFGTLMHLAAMAGNAGRIRFLSKKGLSVIQESPPGYLPLWAAVQSGKINAVAAVLRLGANAKTRDSFGRGALHLFSRQRDIIEILVKAGAPLNGADKYGRGLCPLHVAAVTDQKGWQLALYHKRGAKLDPKDQYGNTPLHWAAYNGNVSGLKQYIRLGGKISPKNNAGLTPLSLASLIGSEDAVTHLTNRGVKLTEREKAVVELYAMITKKNVGRCRELLSKHGKLSHLRIDCGGPPFYFSTPLSLASHLGRDRVVSMLLKSGAPIDSKTYGSGCTPLHLACDAGNLATARLLVENDAELNAQTSPAARDAHPMSLTALHIAAEKGKLDILQLLLENGVDIVKRDSMGRTALHLAASSHNYIIAARIVLKGGQLDQRDNRGLTPGDLLRRPISKDERFYPLTHWALIQIDKAENNHRKQWRACFEKCIQVKTELSAQDWYGNTPLHIAASRNQLWAVKSLLAAKAKIDGPNNCGDTPLHVAARNGNAEIVQLLLKEMADVRTLNCYGRDALAAARAELLSNPSANKLRLQKTVDILKKAAGT